MQHLNEYVSFYHALSRFVKGFRGHNPVCVILILNTVTLKTATLQAFFDEHSNALIADSKSYGRAEIHCSFRGGEKMLAGTGKGQNIRPADIITMC